MPKVAGKSYPYTKAGMMQASRAKKKIKKTAMKKTTARKTGRKMNAGKKKK